LFQERPGNHLQEEGYLEEREKLIVCCAAFCLLVLLKCLTIQVILLQLLDVSISLHICYDFSLQ